MLPKRIAVIFLLIFAFGVSFGQSNQTEKFKDFNAPRMFVNF